MNVTPAYYLCSTGFATVESNFTTYTGCQLKTNEKYYLIHSLINYTYSRHTLAI